MKVSTDSILLGAWIPVDFTPQRVLDIGAGCGLLSLMMAQRFPAAKVDGVELDKPSFEECTANFMRSPWDARLSVFHQRIQDFARDSNANYDLIISNPPFFTSGVSRNSARHTVELSHGELVSVASRLLVAGGVLGLVLPVDSELSVVGLALEVGLFLAHRVMVHTNSGNAVRVLLLFKNLPCECVDEQLFIYEEGVFSEVYLDLVKDFYL